MLLVWQARVGNSTLTCPAHVCHTCASEVRSTRLVRHSLHNFYVDFFIDILLKSTLQFWLFSSRLPLLLNEQHMFDEVQIWLQTASNFTWLLPGYTVSRARIIRLTKVHPAKWARAQESGIVSWVSFTSLDPSTSRLMSNLGSCIWKYLSGIHPPTLKVSGSNPHGGRNKKNFLLQKKITNVVFQLRMSIYAKYLEKRDNSWWKKCNHQDLNHVSSAY